MSEWRLKMLECAKVIPEVWGNQPLTNTIAEALIGSAKEIERLEGEISRLTTENKTMRKALEDIEQMEPSLIDADSSCDMSAIVSGMALASLSKDGES